MSELWHLSLAWPLEPRCAEFFARLLRGKRSHRLTYEVECLEVLLEGAETSVAFLRSKVVESKAELQIAQGVYREAGAQEVQSFGRRSPGGVGGVVMLLGARCAPRPGPEARTQAPPACLPGTAIAWAWRRAQGQGWAQLP